MRQSPHPIWVLTAVAASTLKIFPPYCVVCISSHGSIHFENHPTLLCINCLDSIHFKNLPTLLCINSHGSIHFENHPTLLCMNSLGSIHCENHPTLLCINSLGSIRTEKKSELTANHNRQRDGGFFYSTVMYRHACTFRPFTSLLLIQVLYDHPSSGPAS